MLEPALAETVAVVLPDVEVDVVVELENIGVVMDDSVVFWLPASLPERLERTNAPVVTTITSTIAMTILFMASHVQPFLLYEPAAGYVVGGGA